MTDQRVRVFIDIPMDNLEIRSSCGHINRLDPHRGSSLTPHNVSTQSAQVCTWLWTQTRRYHDQQHIQINVCSDSVEVTSMSTTFAARLNRLFDYGFIRPDAGHIPPRR